MLSYDYSMIYLHYTHLFMVYVSVSSTIALLNLCTLFNSVYANITVFCSVN